MSHFDAITVAARRLRRRRPTTDDAPVAVARGRRPADLRRAVPPRGRPLAVRDGRAAALPPRAGRVPADVDDGVGHRRAGRARSGPRSATAGCICALSGGVDSSVAAALVHRAVGHQLTCIYVDTGLMRKGESAQVTDTFRREMGIELIHVDAADRFFGRLDGRHRPRGQAQGDRRRVHPRLRGAHRRPRRGRVPRPGHAVPGPHRVRRHRRHGGGDQEPPQRRRAARGHAPDADRAAARAVQGRGAPARRTSSGCPTRWCGASRSPAPGSAVRIIGEVTPRQGRAAPGGRRHRAGRDRRGRAGAGDLAVLRRARRHPLGRA